MNVSKEQIDSVISVLRSAVHGDVHGPTGMEGIAMALAGEGIDSNVGSGLKRIAEAIEGSGDSYELGEIASAISSVARALHDVADAIRGEQP